MKSIIKIACFVLSLFLLSLTVWGSTVTLTVVADNYLKKSDRNTNKGGENLLKISEVQKSHDLVAFEQSEITAALNGQPLVSAKLDLYITQNWGGFTTGGRQVNIHRMTTPWGEMGSTWNCALLTTCTTPEYWDGGGAFASTPTDHLQFYDTSIGWKSFDVTSDLNSFIAGTNTNYGFLIKKDSTFVSGDVDFISKENSSATLKPRLVLTIDDPPVVFGTPSPGPNASGWNSASVTVTFTCTDSDSCSCSAPETFTSEGAGQNAHGTCTDSYGLSAGVDVAVSIDKTVPTAQIGSPANGASLAGDHVTVAGSVQDLLSGPATVTCNGSTGGVSDETFTANVPLSLGSNSISCQLTDVAGNSITTSSISVSRVSQVTLTFDATADTYVGGLSEPDANHGSSTNLHIAAVDDTTNVLLKFSQDLMNSQIAGGHVASATLQLYVETVDANWAAGTIVDVHRMTGDWQESTATLDCSSDSDLTNTVPDCDEQWSGGFYENYVSTSSSQLNSTGWKYFDVTSDLQLFQNGIEDFGWLIRKRAYSDPGSLDLTSIQSSTSNKPRLVVVVDDQYCQPTTVQSVSPAWIPSDGSSKTITVSGENLDNVTSVLRNGSPLTFTVVDSGTITFSDSATTIETHQIQMNSSCLSSPLDVYSIEANSAYDPNGYGPESATAADCDSPADGITRLSRGCVKNPQTGTCDAPAEKKALCYKGTQALKLIGIGLPEAITDDNAYCSNSTCMTSNVNCANSSCADTVTRDYFENARYRTSETKHGSNMNRVWVFGASNSSDFGTESMPFPKDANGKYLVKVPTATGTQALDVRYKNRLKQVLSQADKNGQVVLLSLFQYSGAFADSDGYNDSSWNPNNSNMSNCGLPLSTDNNKTNAKTQFYNICSSANGSVCNSTNLTCLGYTERNLVNRIMDVVRSGNIVNGKAASFQNVMIELANEASQRTGVTSDSYLTWYKTVSTWVKNRGGYLVSVNPGPEEYSGDKTHKYLFDCTSSSCSNQYSVVNYNKIDMLSLHAGAWSDYPNLGTFSPCSVAQRGVSNFHKPVMIVDDGLSAYPERNTPNTVYTWVNTATGGACQSLGVVHFDHIEEGNATPTVCSPGTETSEIDCAIYDALGDITPFSNLCTLAGSSCPALSGTQKCLSHNPSCW